MLHDITFLIKNENCLTIRIRQFYNYVMIKAISTYVDVVVNDFHDFFGVVAEFCAEISVVEVLEIFNHIIDDVI